jgi:predicted nucleic acid-binding protein
MHKSLRVVDTSAWIEWLSRTELGKRLHADFPVPDCCLVPALVQYELAAWAHRELGQSERERVIAFTENCRFAQLTRETTLAAAALRLDRRLPTADRLIYATARKLGVDVLTCDAHFEGLPHVVFHRKTTPPRASVSEPRAGYIRGRVPMAAHSSSSLM